jgi:hypothetical protein
MITINGKFNGDVDFIVNISVDSFEDIYEDNMSIKESDKIIAQAISEKYRDEPESIHSIWVSKEIK